MSKQDGRSRQVNASPVRDDSASILHVDMDAFFASVELLERPELRGRPVIVGHAGPRSVVTAATYEARKYGVNSAMPMAIAMRRCPEAVVIEPHFDRYSHYSRIVMETFAEVTPRVEVLGIDEAFLDVSGARRLIGSSWDVGTLLRERVFERTGLHCSVGAAATKFVAKLASSRAKPDGMLVVPASETVAFLHPLPVSGLWGVGAKSEEALARHGLRTIGDVAHTPGASLERWVGVAAAAKLHELAWGRDPRSVTARPEEKSVGHETTFEYDVTDEARLRRELLRMSDLVAVRLRRGGHVARTVVLKLRFGDFTTITRSRTLAEPTNVGRRIYEEVTAAYSAVGASGARAASAEGTRGARIRLIGVRAEQLLPGDGSGAALWDDDEGWRDAEKAIDEVSARFGSGSVRPAALVPRNAERGTRPSVAPGNI